MIDNFFAWYSATRKCSLLMWRFFFENWDSCLLLAVPTYSIGYMGPCCYISPPVVLSQMVLEDGAGPGMLSMILVVLHKAFDNGYLTYYVKPQNWHWSRIYTNSLLQDLDIFYDDLMTWSIWYLRVSLTLQILQVFCHSQFDNQKCFTGLN